MRIMRRVLLIFLILSLLSPGAAALAAAPKILFQFSTLPALMNGLYDGEFSFKQLEKHGNFGLGTFNNLDGEMVALDGRFYQVKTDGRAYAVNPAQKTPFAEVTFFQPDQTLTLSKPLDLKQLQDYLLRAFASPNYPCAIKVSGRFSYVKTRSVPRQTRPFPPLVAVAKHQAVFAFHHVAGTIVGFYHPPYLAGVNLTGFHFHFLTRNRRAGGHLLACRIKQAKVELERLNDLHLRLPVSAAFSRTDLRGSKKHEINQVEK
jgi:acetolactate decarboxylase